MLTQKSKRSFYFSLSFLAFVLFSSFLFFQKKEPDTLLNRACAFCDQKVLDSQTFYEDELVRALYTHKPVFPGHCLVIPKRHVASFEELTEAEATQMALVIKKVHQVVQETFHTSSYLLLQKNGQEVGQTVPHVHFHYIPREKGDSSALKFILKMYIANMRKPIPHSEMQEIVTRLREGIESR